MATQEAPERAAAPPDDTGRLGVDRDWARLPGVPSLVILREPEAGARVVAEMRWGLQHGAEAGRLLLQVRAETIAGRGPLREAARRRRLLVPMDGYVQRASRGEALGREFAIARRDDAPMAVAGIWTEEEDGPRFAIVTCRANEAVAPIHERMPAILGPEAWPVWLGAGLLSAWELAELLRPCPAEWLSLWPLRPRRRVMSPRPGDLGEQLRRLGLDPAAVRSAGTARRRRAAASRIAREGRNAVG